jgi:adenine-specific DNA glycosylase
MLNQTTRTQVEKIMPAFIKCFPTCKEAYNEHEVYEIVRPLGFGNRRTRAIVKLAAEMPETPWNVRQLSGIGEYAARAHEIFCQGILGDSAPNDGSLARYWQWAKASGSYVI